MIKFFDCDYCRNKIGAKNGDFICKAYPDGVPYPEYLNPHEKETCANGYKFEPNEDGVLKWSDVERSLKK